MNIWNDFKLRWLANYLKSFPPSSFEAFSVMQWMHENTVDIPAALPSSLNHAFGDHMQKPDKERLNLIGSLDDENMLKIRDRIALSMANQIIEKTQNKQSAKDRTLFNSFTPDERKALIKEIVTALEMREDNDITVPDVLYANTTALFSVLGFGQTEVSAMCFASRMADRDTFHLFKKLTDKMSLQIGGDPTQHMSRFLDVPSEKLRQILSQKAPLRKASFIELDMRDQGIYVCPPHLLATLKEPHPDPDAIVNHLLGPILSTDRDFDRDFDYLGETGEAIYQTAKGMLEQGLQDGRGSICLYGGSGAGKTTLAAAIAKKLGYTIHDVGQCLPDSFSTEPVSRYHPESGEPGRKEQLNAFLLASFLIGHLGRKAILHLGEMEGIFRDPNNHRFQGGGLKNHLQAALDLNRALTFMTTNRIDLISESTLRRMIPVFHIPPMPWKKRAEVIRANALQKGMDIAISDASILARDFPSLPPGMLEYAVQATAMRPDMKDKNPAMQIRALRLIFNETVRGLQLGLPDMVRTPDISGFDPALMNTTADLQSLSISLRHAAEHGDNYSVCMMGPQGAGKRSCALWLCDRIQRPGHRINFNSLLDQSRLGLNPVALSEAMERASSEGSILVIEGADRLFDERFEMDRRIADCFERPFCPVIVLADHEMEVPWEKLARFNLTIRASYLSEKQQLLAFRSILGQEPPTGFKPGARVTPGDFVRARDQSRILGQDAGILLGSLRHTAMPDRKMGF